MGVDSFLGGPLPAGELALQLSGCGDGRCGSEGGPDDGDRGRPRARGGIGKKKEHEHGGLEEKVLLVAEQPWEGGVNRPLQSVGMKVEKSAALKPGKTTRL
jgi:hypothetical protein